MSATNAEPRFENRADGLFKVMGNTEQRLGNPLAVRARVTDVDSLNWGHAVRFTDPDGGLVEFIVFSGDLYRNPRAILGKMAGAGYHCELRRGTPGDITQYIAESEPPIEVRLDLPERRRAGAEVVA